MKSKRAKDATDFFVSLFKGMNQPKIRKDIENIICLAEQDAEERAVAVAEDFFKEWKDVPIQDWMITEFKEKLNGGQSDG